jgi:hypothetical protein
MPPEISPMTTIKNPHAKKGGPKDRTAQAKPWRVAQTREGARAIGGNYPAEPVLAFRVLAAAEEKDVQQLLAEALNMLFENRGVAERFPVDSGRRTRTYSGA